MRIGMNSPPGGLRWENADAVIRHGFLNMAGELLDGHDLIWLFGSEGVSWDSPSPWGFRSFREQVSDLRECDVMIKVGSPAWFNQPDIEMYRICRDQGIPYHLYGIGVGGRWRWSDWDVYEKRSVDLIRILNAAECGVVACRDQNCLDLIQTFKVGGEVEVIICPGFFALPPRSHPSPDIIRVMFDVLDPATLKGNGASSDDDVSNYYDFVRRSLDFLDREGVEVAVTAMRAIVNGNGDEPLSIEPSEVERADTVWGYAGYWRRAVGDRPVLYAPSAASFTSMCVGMDAVISGRVHGVLPNAGRGTPCLGLGIDLRHRSWAQVPEIDVVDMRGHAWGLLDISRWWGQLPDRYDRLSRALLERRRAETEHQRTILRRILENGDHV